MLYSRRGAGGKTITKIKRDFKKSISINEKGDSYMAESGKSKNEISPPFYNVTAPTGLPPRVTNTQVNTARTDSGRRAKRLWPVMEMRKSSFLLFGYLPETNLLELSLANLKWGKKLPLSSTRECSSSWENL